MVTTLGLGFRCHVGQPLCFSVLHLFLRVVLPTSSLSGFSFLRFHSFRRFGSVRSVFCFVLPVLLVKQDKMLSVFVLCFLLGLGLS